MVVKYRKWDINIPYSKFVDVKSLFWKLNGFSKKTRDARRYVSTSCSIFFYIINGYYVLKKIFHLQKSITLSSSVFLEIPYFFQKNNLTYTILESKLLFAISDIFERFSNFHEENKMFSKLNFTYWEWISAVNIAFLKTFLFISFTARSKWENINFLVQHYITLMITYYRSFYNTKSLFNGYICLCYWLIVPPKVVECPKEH